MSHFIDVIWRIVILRFLFSNNCFLFSFVPAEEVWRFMRFLYITWGWMIICHVLLADPPSGGVSSRFTHVHQCVSASVISWLNCLMSLVLDEISIWNLLETFLRCFYTSSKYFWIFWRHSWDVCMLLPNNSEFIICLSVCYIAFF